MAVAVAGAAAAVIAVLLRARRRDAARIAALEAENRALAEQIFRLKLLEQREAVLGGRHGERVALIEEENALERMLKSKFAGLRSLPAEAMRPVPLSGAEAEDAHF